MGVVIDCEHQFVRIRTPGGGDLVVRGERAQYGPILCLAARVRRYLHQGCFRFFAYIMDTQDKDKATVEDVPIVWEYLDVFPKDFPGVP